MIRNFIAANALIFAATTAQAETITPQQVSDRLAMYGVSELLITPTEESNSSMITGTIDDVKFIADVRDCEADRTGCLTVLFFANFRLGRETVSDDYIQANAYNDRRTWGRAYVLVDEIGVDYAVGLNDENEFGENEIEIWKLVLSAFKEHNSVIVKNKD